MTEQELLTILRAAPHQTITWWPGGSSHDAVLSLQDKGLVELTDVSQSQETMFLVRLADQKESE